MYTRRNRCLPTFHSTSTISRPSERATRSAAPRIFSKSTQRLLDPSRSALHSNRPNKKVGLRPPLRATRFRAKGEYIPPARQKQDTPPRLSAFAHVGARYIRLLRNKGEREIKAMLRVPERRFFIFFWQVHMIVV